MSESPASKRAKIIRLRIEVSLYEAAYLVQDQLGGYYDDALGLVVEAAASGDLRTQIEPKRNSWTGEEIAPVEPAVSTAKTADVQDWLSKLKVKDSSQAKSTVTPLPRPPFQDKWLNRELWTLLDAAQVLVGIEPLDSELVGDNPHEVLRLIANPTHCDEFKEVYTKLKDATTTGSLRVAEPPRTGAIGNTRVVPGEVVAWAKLRGVSISERAAVLRTSEATNSDDETASTPPVEEIDAELAALFDPVGTPQLEVMFPAGGKWKDWTDRASRNGLCEARVGKAKYNPFKAAMWMLSKQSQHGWDMSRCLRTLADNLPPRARSTDARYKLTGALDD